jgi:hypothetical protein
MAQPQDTARPGADSPSAAPHSMASVWSRGLRPELPAALLAAALATAIAVVVLQVWQANFIVPLYASPGGYGTFGIAVINGNPRT